MNNLMTRIDAKSKKSRDYIREKIDKKSPLAIILGTGLDYEITKKIKNPFKIPYEEIPYFSKTIDFHKGNMVFGELNNKELILMNGRYHFYEGYSLQNVVYPIHVLKKLGVENIIITSSVGGINKNINIGDLMLVKDHINLTSLNPLIGYNNIYKNIFLNCSDLYNKSSRTLAKKIASQKKIFLKEGVMFFLPGPTLETKAEFNAMKKLGADTIGWSTIPEAITAHYLDIDVLAINCITDSLNNKESPSLKKITKIANKSSKKIYSLIYDIIPMI